MIDISTIPEEYIGWNRRTGFCDLREEAAVKLATALHDRRLDHLIDIRSWIRDKPKQLCLGCIFGEDAWQAKLASDASTERAARLKAARPGPSARKKLNGQAAPS